jgi:hypothetical protein
MKRFEYNNKCLPGSYANTISLCLLVTLTRRESILTEDRDLADGYLHRKNPILLVDGSVCEYRQMKARKKRCFRVSATVHVLVFFLYKQQPKQSILHKQVIEVGTTKATL